MKWDGQNALFYAVFVVGFISLALLVPQQEFLQSLSTSSFAILLSIFSVLSAILFYGVIAEWSYPHVFKEKYNFFESKPGIKIFGNMMTKYIVTVIWYFFALVPFLPFLASNFHEIEGPTAIIIPAVFLIVIFFYRFGKKNTQKIFYEEMQSVLISTAVLGAIYTFGGGFDIQNVPSFQTGQLILLVAFLDLKLIR